MSEAPRDLVLKALELIGRSAPSIANCRQLSMEIKYHIGRNLSASTLYRMLNPERQGVRPYAYSVETVELFLAQLASVETGLLVGKQTLFTQPNAPQSSFYHLVVQELSAESRSALTWFQSLPTQHWTLGWEQWILANALMDALPTGQAMGNTFWSELVQSPQFSTYYLETYVDLNRPFDRYASALLVQFEHLRTQFEQKADKPDWSSLFFNASMLSLLAFLSKRRSLLKRMTDWLKEPNAVAEMESDRLFPLVKIRVHVARMIGAQNRKHYLEQLERTQQELRSIFIGRNLAQAREFAYSILCDGLVLVKDRKNLSKLLVALPPPNERELTLEPAIVRMRVYRTLFGHNQPSDARMAAPAFITLGQNERVFHELMLEAAKSLKSEVAAPKSGQKLIEISGFEHFRSFGI